MKELETKEPDQIEEIAQTKKETQKEMKKYSKLALCALVLGAAVFTSCSKDDEEVAATPSIYERLGGSALVADPDNAGQMIEAGRLSYRKVEIGRASCRERVSSPV